MKVLQIVVGLIAILLFVGIVLAPFFLPKIIKKIKESKEQAKTTDTEEENVLSEEERRYYHYTKKKRYLSVAEKECFLKIKEAIKGTGLVCFPQVNLATIIQKTGNYRYMTELFRNIDFGLFDMYTTEPKIAIELNDSTHFQKDRIDRDKKVSEILQSANIPLITLYTKETNTVESIKEIIERAKELIK